MHDVAEVYTGDVPAPFKWDNPHVAAGLKVGEAKYAEEHNLFQHPLTPEEEQLLKVADMLDLVLSSLEELGRGNLSAKQLVINGSSYIADMELSGSLMLKCDEMVREVKAQWLLTN
jgi:5'-deoxynucleotidase YfbR-like HD superfamily hydrolase